VKPKEDESMKNDRTQLAASFGCFPEAIFFLQDGAVVYANPAGLKLELELGDALTHTAEDLLHTPGMAQCHMGGKSFCATVSPYGGGTLFSLRQLVREEVWHPPSLAAVRLRNHLTLLTAVTDRLAQKLTQESGSPEYHRLLAQQNQALHRLLRLTRQIELTQHDWDDKFPFHALDLTRLCEKIFDEFRARTAIWHQTAAFRNECPSLLTTGSSSLLEHLILALLTNAASAAGEGGTIDFRLHQKGGRAVLSVGDSGGGIAEARFLHIFRWQDAERLPLPEDGTGIDLWIAQRIAARHGGVLVAANKPAGGAELTVSLPVTPPETLTVQDSANTMEEEGFSPVLVALSDVLPWQMFTPAAD
jgi:hypothetical protein